MKSTVTPYETVAWCVRIECVNGSVFRLTSYPLSLTMSNSEVYNTDSGYDFTAYSASSALAPSAIDLEGLVGIAGINFDMITSGIFDNARIKIFKCNYLNPIEDYEKVASGIFGKTVLEDGKYKVEGMSLVDALNQVIGKTYTASCSRTFGDSGCGISLPAVTVTGTLTGVASNYVVVDSSRYEPSDTFTYGTFEFTSGPNVGLRPIEIKSYDVSGVIELFDSAYYTPVVGNTYKMIYGCRKRLEDCSTKYNNVVNFFGFSFIPVSSTYSSIGSR